MSSSVKGHDMPFLGLALGLLLAGGGHVIFKHHPQGKQNALKVLGILLFGVYALRLMQTDVIDDVVGFDGDLPAFETAVLLILKWSTIVVVLVNVIAPSLKDERFKTASVIAGLPVLLLDFILYGEMLKAFSGLDATAMSFRGIQYACELGVSLAISLSFLITSLEEDRGKSLRAHGKQALLLFLVLHLPLFPESFLQVFIGKAGTHTADYDLAHRLMLYVILITMIVLFLYYKDKPLARKRTFLLVVGIAGFFQYFYPKSWDAGIGALPLHLCNTAIIMMLLAFTFHWDGVFYFSFFVNVAGALFAVLMPTVTTDVLSVDSMHFWINHAYDIMWPVLAVGLGVWKRPNMKMMLKAIGIFTIYFVSMMIVNAWFNGILMAKGEEATIDYFFLYGDQISGKAAFLTKIHYRYVLEWIQGGLTFRVYWLMDILIYFGFIAFMFIEWYLYDALFRIADSHKDLHMTLERKRMDMLNLKEEMDKRAQDGLPADDGEPSVVISHFTKVYPGSHVKAVDDFNLAVHAGEIFGFLGHNGAGKSTTIKSMVGIQPITEGKIEICGHDVAKQPLEAKLQVGYVSDNHAVYERLTGREYVNYVADLYQVPLEIRHERLERYVALFSLEGAIDEEIAGYSHGMKQKIVVISSLIHDPKVWVLDEPLTGLDPVSSYQIKECMIEHAARGNIVFFSSHIIDTVEKICDRVAIISDGKMKGVFTMADLRAQGTSLESLYLKYVVPVAEQEKMAKEFGEIK